MAVTIEEVMASREITSGNSPAVTLKYIVRGTAISSGVLALAESTAPAEYNGQERQTVRIEPEFVDEAANTGIWNVTASYGPPRTNSVMAAGESQYSFDTGGGTQHITQAKAQQVFAVSGTTAPEYNKAIGVTRDSVEGVDIVVPVYNWSETHVLDDETVTEAYKITLFNLTGRTNNATFRGFAAGEVLFLGASGTSRSDGKWEITFKFAASPNRTDIGDIPGITVTSKTGWQYLWVEYSSEEDPTSHRMTQKPLTASVATVYDSGDFSGLGIE